jgi:phosphomannomutase
MIQHLFHKEILRAYDFRGTFGKTLFNEDAKALGSALGYFLQEIEKSSNDTVVVGYDGRHSSAELADNLSQGLLLAGMKVIQVGLGPTPMLYFAVGYFNAAAGIMVTGSHNPPEDNGFKVMLSNRPFFGEDIQRIGVLAAQGFQLSGELGRIDQQNMYDRYNQHLLSNIRLQRPLNIAWDCGNGAVGAIFSSLIKDLPGEHRVLNDQVDGSFPCHPPDPTKPQNLVELQEVLREGSFDLGVAFDGDGDRLVALSGIGQPLTGDELLKFFAENFLREHPGSKIIGDLKCSDALFSIISTLGGEPIMCRTGHSFIKQKMLETGAKLAGEVSGHYFFKDRYGGYDDGVYAALRLMEMLSAQEFSLEHWLAHQTKTYITPEIKIPCDELYKQEVIKKLADGLMAKGFDLMTLDGVRYSNQNGWWLIRSSNTEAMLVLRTEAATQSDLNATLSMLENEFVEIGVDKTLCQYNIIGHYKR